jgi:ABC-2 type transport system permease protein
LATLVTTTLQAAGVETEADALGLSPEQVTDLLAGGVTVQELDTQDDEEERSGIAFIGTILLFVSIVTYGQWILIGVVEEKTSRVVEVILGAVQPRHLLAGKVIGIGVLGLGQLVLIAAIGLIAMRTNQQLDVPSIGVGFALTLIGWFLLGFTFYAAGYAVAGSLVSRQEDAQNASFPLTMVMLVAYFVAISAIGGEDNPVLRVLSIIPPFSAITMPVRQATGNATPVEVVLSVVLMLGAIVLMLRVGGRIYAGGLLRTGGRVKIREALRSADG